MQKTFSKHISNDNPLDEINFHRVKTGLHNRAGISYIDFKKTLKPDYIKVWMDICLGWASLIIIIALAGWLIDHSGKGWDLLLSVLAAIPAGFMIAYLVNFFHEAVHYNICANKKRNDRFANIFIGILLGQGIKNYRVIHWQHHISLGSPQDTEISYFESLDFRFIAYSLTGVSALKVLTKRNQFMADHEKLAAPGLKREKYLQLCLGCLFHGLVLTLLMVTHQYWQIVTWLLAVGGFYPLFNRLRQLIEHRSDQADKKINYTQTAHGKLSRTFGNSMLDKTFGSAGFNKHLLHHLEPAISYTRLNALEDFLKETALGDHIKQQQTSYLSVFKKLFNK